MKADFRLKFICTDVFEIDKKKFGAFVAKLRKEKGFTHKELAGRLFISDKAASKWGIS
ncbi:helix-turn-helix domain-containing protein [Sporofaciens musculi]|uniref:helix-turn-helix domain-containing protein n=1 Tax=Sporofaciens musculi TaxID=2681861 RepID=UPI001FCB3EE1|nr:helix-turn-helix domain-containing protein [Sporofaciens musculi]